MTNLANKSVLTAASSQWASRPADQRFLSLTEMQAFAHSVRDRSSARVASTRRIMTAPVADTNHRGLILVDDQGQHTPTHWAFGQLAERAKAPAAYLRRLPCELAADCLNYGLRREGTTDVGLLSRTEETGLSTLAAATGPNYGRVWNSDVIDALISRFGNGVDGDFRVPGEFGVQVDVDRRNTTLYASDRDMFVFLADETHRIEVPDRRNGEPGTLARGFFVWNSEVGSQTLGVGTFLFDYVCMNRIVWGAQGYTEIRVRHTASAPHRWIEEIAPAITAFANSETHSITDAVAAARAQRIEDDIEDFLANYRFNGNQAKAISMAHLADEGRPIETVWDAVTGITAYAREIPYQDDRVAIERVAGKILEKVAA